MAQIPKANQESENLTVPSAMLLTVDAPYIPATTIYKQPAVCGDVNHPTTNAIARLTAVTKNRIKIVAIMSVSFLSSLQSHNGIYFSIKFLGCDTDVSHCDCLRGMIEYLHKVCNRHTFTVRMIPKCFTHRVCTDVI